MNAAAPQTTYLKDYKSPGFAIKSTDLRFELFNDYTLVYAKLTIDKLTEETTGPLVLDGCELELLTLTINGDPLPDEAYQVDEESLCIANVPESFVLELVTRIYPQSNTSLEGLYRSRTMYCTQCEAEGFRKITYFLDRPDVLSVYNVRIEADKAQFPVLLANGNCVAAGDLDDGRHFAEWHDPFLKPSYLFALVAGDLACVKDSYTTASGKKVAIEIYVEEKDLSKCEHAIESLKNAMRWDEQVYGREYDLNVYMIVAVDDFNMGAMENKGLNIFNTSCVLASPTTTTDAAYQRVEGVIAHEYFHNWSGNRVTCRDWFQLSLKEGFTVFRDEEFSADMGSKTVKRVEDVQLLRSLQFAEDAGPMAHPVRPASYIEISNFYTLTVYEKGAEVVRMIRTLIGEDAFRKGSDIYFQNNDGKAATIEDFIAAMHQASGYDFTQFMNWYSQAGTPHLKVTGVYDVNAQTYTLTLKQSCKSTPEATAEEKSPFVIPVALGLVGEQSVLPMHSKNSQFRSETATHGVFLLTEKESELTFDRVSEPPVPALLRNFSAPVTLDFEYSPAQLLRLMSLEQDGFSRWDASEKLAILAIKELVEGTAGESVTSLLTGFESLLDDESLDPAMVALMLELPSEAYLGEQFVVYDVDAVHFARKKLADTIALQLQSLMLGRYQLARDELHAVEGFNAGVIGTRSLKNRCLHYLMRINKSEYTELCWQQFEHSHVMSDEHAAFSALVFADSSEIVDKQQQAIEQFYQKWKTETLVMNQWLSVQAAASRTGALQRVKSLLEHPAYDEHNPNKIRSVISVFCAQNLVNFHDLSGSGYEFLAEQIIRLNDINPQIAARMVTPLSKWRRYSEARQTLMRAQLERINANPKLSKDVYEMVAKSLKV